jgi:hypothetical protein
MGLGIAAILGGIGLTIILAGLGLVWAGRAPSLTATGSPAAERIADPVTV